MPVLEISSCCDRLTWGLAVVSGAGLARLWAARVPLVSEGPKLPAPRVRGRWLLVELRESPPHARVSEAVTTGAGPWPRSS